MHTGSVMLVSSSHLACQRLCWELTVFFVFLWMRAGASGRDFDTHRHAVSLLLWGRWGRCIRLVKSKSVVYCCRPNHTSVNNIKLYAPLSLAVESSLVLVVAGDDLGICGEAGLSLSNLACRIPMLAYSDRPAECANSSTILR